MLEVLCLHLLHSALPKLHLHLAVLFALVSHPIRAAVGVDVTTHSSAWWVHLTCVVWQTTHSFQLACCIFRVPAGCPRAGSERCRGRQWRHNRPVQDTRRAANVMPRAHALPIVCCAVFLARAPPHAAAAARHAVRDPPPLRVAVQCRVRTPLDGSIDVLPTNLQLVPPHQACRLSAALPRPPAALLSRTTQRRRAGASRGAAVAIADAYVRVWVKPPYSAPYCEVAGVDLQWRVQQLRAHVLAVLRPRNVVLAQLTLSLVARGGGAPDAAAERAALSLDDPSASLADAGVADRCWLLARVCSAAAAPDDAVRDATLRTDLLEAPAEARYVVARLSDKFLSELLDKLGGLGLVAELREDAPLLRNLDELRDGGTYYIKPSSGTLTDQVDPLAWLCGEP